MIISCAGHWSAEEKKDPTPKQCRATPFITRTVTATAQLRKGSKRRQTEVKRTGRQGKREEGMSKLGIACLVKSLAIYTSYTIGNT